MTAGKVLLVAAIAMGTGAVLGVLFAPDKGTITRKKLAKHGSRYLGTLEKKASEYVDTIGENFESVRETAAGITDRMMDAVGSLAGHETQKHTRRT
jgi:gas vesicle protein